MAEYIINNKGHYLYLNNDTHEKGLYRYIAIKFFNFFCLLIFFY